jgi:outer membrane lipoprotein carrier protein
MKGMRRVGVWAFFLCVLTPTFAQAGDSADVLIQKVEQRYNRAKTLTVEFVEDYSIQGHMRPVEKGKLTLRKQGKMRWDYTVPAGKIFVSDGKMIYLYTSDDNRVEKIPLRDTEDMRAPLAFLLGHLDLKKEFRDFSVRPLGPSAEWLMATARSEKTPYAGIEMLVKADGEISSLVVMGRDGSRLHFDLTHEQVNPPVNDALFAFKIPPGADVVNAVEYAGEGR